MRPGYITVQSASSWTAGSYPCPESQSALAYLIGPKMAGPCE